uniref:exodeoxyribonuclease VII small subunit n=1 Tax=Lachnospira sp. TaxID=2049031 RepID=UPI003FEFB62D
MAKSPSLEDTFDKLEDILGQMESGELTMNESFKKYKEGIELVKKCSLMIDKVEIEMIIINDDKDSEMIDDD